MINVLIYDIETDGLDPATANLKWFGAYSLRTKRYYVLYGKEINAINRLLSSHEVLVGYNNKLFDNPILTRAGFNLRYKTTIDLYEICKNRDRFGGKGRLAALNIKLKSFKLKNVIAALNLDTANKGEIDYKIFKKNKWSQSELKQIRDYIRKDIEITFKLYKFLDEEFSSVKEFLSQHEIDKHSHINTSIGSLAYRVLCNKAGIPVLWRRDEEITERKNFAGGHHVTPRWEKVRGNIFSIDFASAYPHQVFMNNLYSHSCQCCKDSEKYSGNGYFKLQGKYCTKKLGSLEKTMKEIYMLRMEAKKKCQKIGKALGDKKFKDEVFLRWQRKERVLKLIINSCYGISGNQYYKQLFNVDMAADCTYLVRSLLRRIAAKIESNGCRILYGFTDGLYVWVPHYISRKQFEKIIQKFLDDVKKIYPFPVDTFRMPIEEQYKFMWFIERKRNWYLWVDADGKAGHKSTVFNEGTPELVLKLWREFLAPRIEKNLDVNFSKTEVIDEVKKRLSVDPLWSAEEYTVKELSAYKVKTSLQYQISTKYGEGKHLLIPNIVNLGIGRGKATKTSKAKRYCTIAEFKENKLTPEDISIDKILTYLKPFYTTKTEVIDDVGGVER